MLLLNINEPEKLNDYLHKNQSLLKDENVLKLTKPGEGNMNCVLRATTNLQTFIVKQSREYVEKYPHVAAPANRILIEGAFYKKINQVEDLQKMMPKMYELDFENNIMILEDLGKSQDFSYLYNENQTITNIEITTIIDFLNHLHSAFNANEKEAILENQEMRKLNHEHIFEYPFMVENGFDLDNIQVGLQEIALIYKSDESLKKIIATYGKTYLEIGNYLLHGDYYPGSWLKTNNGIKIIDPEFCFFGFREFDLAVMIAHLYLSEQNENLIKVAKENYYDFDNLNQDLLNSFIGIEIMRRIIGLAQLPLIMTLEKKKDLLSFAHSLIQ